jgi:hypothetical protein
MNILKPKNIEDRIINLLIDGEKSTISLLEQLKLTMKITKQGFYASLRKLRANETVVVYKGKVSLNTTWISKMRDLIETIGRAYTTEPHSSDFLNLNDKESISYSFASIKNLDSFWGHTQNILIHNTPQNEPIYCYDPHYWLYLVRRETEKELLKEIVKIKKQFLMSVGAKTKLDKLIRSDFNNDYLQYNYKRIFEKENYYITVIGDYITEVKLDEKTAREIDTIYQRENLDTKTALELLAGFIHSKMRNKIKITRNSRMANKLKKMMGKDFFVMKRKIEATN